MKKIFNYNTYNESVRDTNGVGLPDRVSEGLLRSMMTPKSIDSIKKYTDKLGSQEKLFRGCKDGLKWLVDEAIAEGQDVHVLNDTALRIASKYGNAEIVDMLIKMGSDINAFWGMALKNAVEGGHIDVVKLLLKAGINLHLKATEPLFLLTKNYRTKDIYNLLLQYDKTNESIRDQMTPKSKEDIKKSLKDSFPTKNLEMGCKNGLLWLVKDALDEGVDIHYFHDIALRIAAEKGHIDIVKLLIDKGANIHACSEEALRNAIEYGHSKIVKLLIDKGADVHNDRVDDLYLDYFGTEAYDVLQRHLLKQQDKSNESVRDQMTPKSEEDIINSLKHLSVTQKFELGIEKDVLWLIKYALEHGANPDYYKTVKTLGRIIEEDISVNRKELIKLLIEHGVNIHFKDDAILTWCVRKGWKDMIELLIEKGANVNAQKGEALMWACNLDRPDLVQLLIDNGANVNLYPNLLKNYSEYGYTKIIKILLDNGKFLQGELDESLRYACTRGHLDTVKVLVEYGADIHTDEDAPVMISAVNNQIDIVKFLVEKGADIQCRKNMPLQRAAYYGHIEMMKLLVSYGANIRDDDDASLVEAVKQGQLEAVKFLLKLGANANEVREHDMLYIEKNKKEIVRLIKQHQWYERKIKKTNESIRDTKKVGLLRSKMTPKSIDEIKNKLIGKVFTTPPYITELKTTVKVIGMFIDHDDIIVQYVCLKPKYKRLQGSWRMMLDIFSKIYTEKVDESIRDLMTPKSMED